MGLKPEEICDVVENDQDYLYLLWLKFSVILIFFPPDNLYFYLFIFQVDNYKPAIKKISLAESADTVLNNPAIMYIGRNGKYIFLVRLRLVRNVPGMILNCIWWWRSSSGAHGSMESPLHCYNSQLHSWSGSIY